MVGLLWRCATTQRRSLPGAGNEYGLQQTLASARAHGVIDVGVTHGLCSKTTCTPEVPRKHCRWAPTAFLPHETESQEANKYRLLISHALHPLRRLSKTIGPCLTLWLKEWHTASPFWGMPTMHSVRDVWTHLHQSPPHTMQFWEQGIAYWELDKELVLKAVHNAAELVGTHRKTRVTSPFLLPKPAYTKTLT